MVMLSECKIETRKKATANLNFRRVRPCVRSILKLVLTAMTLAATLRHVRT
jgi:hypothetical protein